jgi:hypothetical protein
MEKAIYTYRKSISRLLQMLAVVLLISFAYKSDAQQIFSNPEVKARATLDTNKILVGQQTTLHLQVDVPKDLMLQWPLLNDTLQANVDVISASQIDTLQGAKEGFIRLHQDIVISSFDSGYYAIPPFYFMYGKANDTLNNHIEMAESNALLLEVHNVKVNFKKDIKDIKPILDEPWQFKEFLPYILIIGAIFLIIAIGVYIYFRIKNDKPIFAFAQKPKIPAHIIALEKLNKLKEQKLWQTGSAKEFYSELTDILREYMEGQLHFGAMEMISDDIFSELQKQELDKDLFDETQSVLQTADLVKFAKVEPLADENDRALKWGFSFVEKTMPQEQVDTAKENSKSSVEPSKTIDQ